MSRTRSNSQGSSNPATKYLGWDTQASAWEFYDKENKQSCTLPSSTAFIVLDQLNTAKGWDDRKGGLWSNEVRSVADQLTIRSKDGVVATGTWSEVKTTNGIKFTKSVYAMAKVGEGYELVNFQLKGCALTAWIEFQDSIGGQSKLEGDVVVAVKDVVADKKGAVSFNKPVFGIVAESLSPAASEEADGMDSDLQHYLDSYLNTPKEPSAEEENDTPPVSDASFDEEDPF